MLYVAGNAQLPVLDNSRVELWSKGRLGPCVAQQEMVLNCQYMLLLCRIFLDDEDKNCFQLCPSSVRVPFKLNCCLRKKTLHRQCMRLYHHAFGLGRIMHHDDDHK